METLGVATDSNREYSFTDKDSAFWYGQARAQGTGEFEGWNIATQQIFSDYQLTVDGKPVDRQQALVMVYPHRIVRRYAWGEEVFELFDHQPVLQVTVTCARDLPLGLALQGTGLHAGSLVGEILPFSVDRSPGCSLGVTTVRPAEATVVTEGGVTQLRTRTSAGGFFIALESSPGALAARLARARAEHGRWKAERTARMNRLLERNAFRSDDPLVDAAVGWNILSLDALITRQTGQGIYAGLPWFNDYWGRDMFISLPGACLVTGQLEVARDILRSFARYQNTDPGSPDFGRVPNRLRPDDIIYNTTDGTPLFVRTLRQYVQYSGDTGLVRELYPAVRRSIEGPLQYRVDARSYLTHDDADTWMDAKWHDRVPWSPRGNRANDVQALWLGQLQAGVYFAGLMGDEPSAARWARVAVRLRDNFGRDFITADQTAMADRLRADGRPDFTFRPNQLFALDFVPSLEKRVRLTRRIWETLVYPWGVASLEQDDPNFHPWLEHRTYLHKDEAYHNGTVWLWNNGVAIDRMIEAGQPAPAYALFHRMCRQSLQSAGAVGTLSELNNALPRPGQESGVPAGAFDQAWSGAEFLRVWYQSFLGLRPDAVGRTLAVAPQLQGNLHSLEFTVPLWDGLLRGNFAQKDDVATYRYAPQGLTEVPALLFKLPGYAEVPVTVREGEVLVVTAGRDRLTVEVLDRDGKSREKNQLKPDEAELAQVRQLQALMSGVRFAEPRLNPALDCLQPGHGEALGRKLAASLPGPAAPSPAAGPPGP